MLDVTTINKECLGEVLGKGGKREISGTKDNTHFQRDGRKLALGHELLQLCFEAQSADPAVLITCRRTLWRCV